MNRWSIVSFLSQYLHISVCTIRILQRRSFARSTSWISLNQAALVVPGSGASARFFHTAVCSHRLMILISWGPASARLMLWIEPATFELVEQWLNQLRHRVPRSVALQKKKKNTTMVLGPETATKYQKCLCNWRENYYRPPALHSCYLQISSPSVTTLISDERKAVVSQIKNSKSALGAFYFIALRNYHVVEARIYLSTGLI